MVLPQTSGANATPSPHLKELGPTAGLVARTQDVSRLAVTNQPNQDCEIWHKAWKLYTPRQKNSAEFVPFSLRVGLDVAMDGGVR